MLDRFKRLLRRSSFLYQTVWFLTIAAKMPFYVIRNFGQIISTHLDRRTTVMFYLNYPMHYGVFDPIPERLAKTHRVYLLCYFPRREKRMDVSPDIRVIYGCNDALIPLLRSDVHITPREEEKLFPRGSSRVLLVHSLVNSEGLYIEDVYDNYDYIYCAGRHQLEEFRDLFRRRKTRPKCLIPGGYPKLSRQIARAKRLAPAPSQAPGRPVTVIYAPTHFTHVNQSIASLKEHGMAIVQTLIESDARVIFRPHPLNVKHDPGNAVLAIVERYRRHERFTLDTSEDYFATYAEADIMVTDISGTGITYAFVFEKPVIFFAHNAEAEQTLSGIQYQGRENMGAVARTVSDLPPRIADLSNNYHVWRRRVAAYRDSMIYHVEDSHEYLIANLHHLINRTRNDEWTYV